jgi:hypothetical protein
MVFVSKIAVALVISLQVGMLSAAAVPDAPSNSKNADVSGKATPTVLSQWIDSEMNLVSRSARGLDQEQLKWGAEQVRQMLKDRPAMAPYIKEGDPLWDWTVRQFAGEGSHLEVKWDGFWPKEIEMDRDAGTRGDPPDSKIHIHVSALYGGTGSMKDQALLKGKPKEGPMLWYQTIFELYNARKFARSLKIFQRALKGNIDRETFILEMDMMEQDTRKEAHEFYQNLWTSQCHAQGLPCEDSVLAIQLKSDTLNFKTDFLPEDRINEMKTLKEADDHYHDYGIEYDSSVVPNLAK